MEVNLDATELEETNRAAHDETNLQRFRSARPILLAGRALSRPYNVSVVAAEVSFATSKRIGSMCDSKKPWRLKKFWERSSGRSVSRVIRRNFFCFAKLIAYSSSCEP